MKKGNTLYLECRSGISGDMTVGALLDLGATEKRLHENLSKLQMSGYDIAVKKVEKSSMMATDFDVILEEGCGDSSEHFHHRHEDHSHQHQTWGEIQRMLLDANLPKRVYQLACEMFETIAKAEGKVHGKSPEEVHFYEVGAIDSIVDIVSVASCLDELNIEKVVVSTLCEGTGYVDCQHGTLPVPVPAVLEIAAENGLVLKQTSQKGEMVTPTGAAIAALSHGQMPKEYQVKRVGIGSGKKELSHANILRAILIEEEGDFCK